MADRYLKIFTLPPRLYANGSPVIVEAGALHKDSVLGDVVAQLKFRSLVQKDISTITVDIMCFDSAKQVITPSFVYKYVDLDLQKTDLYFGQKTLITLPNTTTRSFEVRVKHVQFTDGSELSVAADNWNPIPQQPDISTYGSDFKEHFQRKYGDDGKSEPMIFEDLWLCSCQKENKQDVTFCSKCGKAYSLLFPFDIEQEKRDAIEEKCLERLERERQAEIARKEAERIAKRNKKIVLIATSISAILITMAILLTKVIIPTCKYNKAVDLMKNGEFDDAYTIFGKLGNYKDSMSKLDEVKSLHLKTYGFETTKDGFVTYGSYEQDNNKENGKEKIEWIVLKVQNNRALLLSKYCLESKTIIGSYRNDVTWENSDLYEWLNTEFVEVAFSNEEKNNILNDITLLTSSELYEFSETHDIKNAVFTRYGQAFSLTDGENGETAWWLKGTGNCVDSKGLEGYTGPNKPCGVRPVIWIDLNL